MLQLEKLKQHISIFENIYRKLIRGGSTKF